MTFNKYSIISDVGILQKEMIFNKIYILSTSLIWFHRDQHSKQLSAAFLKFPAAEMSFKGQVYDSMTAL